MTSISSYGGAQIPPGVDTADWVHARFERAVDIVQSLPRSGPIQTNYDDKLLLYSVYKQATEGDIKVSRPGLLDVLGRAKWDAWNKKKGLTTEEAERMYVQGLLKILRGYSDRPQAIELMRELETFSLDPRGMVMSGSLAASSMSSSSSTEGDEPQRHHRQHASTSRQAVQRVPPSHSNRGRQQPPPIASTSHRSRAPPPPASTTSASVAPSLPGYGPPRTRADSPRRSDEPLSDEDDYTSSSEDDEGRRRPRQYYDQAPASLRAESMSGYQPPPLTPQQYAQGSSLYGGNSGLQPPHQYQRSHQGGVPQRVMSPPLAPSPQFHTPSQQYPFSPQQPPPSAGVRPQTSFTRSAAPSPGPSGQQQVGMMYPPGIQLQQQLATARPSTASSTAVRNTAPAVPAGLDAALDRIQTSLTALHERLAELERSSSPSSSSTSLNDLESPLGLLRFTFYKLLVLLKIRQSSPQLNSLTWRNLFLKFFLNLMRFGRRVMGDLGIAVLMIALLGRVTGRNIGIQDGFLEVFVGAVRRLGGVKKIERRVE